MILAVEDNFLNFNHNSIQLQSLCSLILRNLTHYPVQVLFDHLKIQGLHKAHIFVNADDSLVCGTQFHTYLKSDCNFLRL